MKKTLLIVFVLWSTIAFEQTNYTKINNRYTWLAIQADNGFNFPAGRTHTLFTGQSVRAGAVIYDSVQGKLYVNIGANTWRPLVDTTYIGWGFLGNAGLSATTNFVGTTDFVPLNFKVNNEKAGRIDISSESTFLGYQAGNNWTSGFGNAGFGSKALATITTAIRNTAVGRSALTLNTTGSANVSVGYLSLQRNTTGFDNVGIGTFVLSNNSTGSFNTVVGYDALQANETSHYNTALGFQAGFGVIGKNNIIIGADTSGSGGLTDGNYNTIIGGTVSGFSGSISNNIIIADGAGNKKLWFYGADSVQLKNTFRRSSTRDKVAMIDTITGLITYTDGASGSTALSAITAATGTNTINNSTYLQEWDWGNITSSGLLLTSNTTAAVNAQNTLEVRTFGTNASSSITTNGAIFTNTHAGTGSINNAISVSATTGGINNAIYVNAGNVNIQPLTASQLVGTDASKNLVSVPTITNTRWTARVGSTTSSATPTINTDNVDIYKLTAQSADITSFTTNLSGTPADGDILEIQVTGTAARALTFGSSFVSSTVTIPTTTVTTATLTIIFQFYTTSSYGTSKWVCVNYY